MTYRIVADSSCDLRSYDSPLETLTYATVPLKIRVGQREFTDNAALDTRQMMDAMHNYNGPTSSACPTVAFSESTTAIRSGAAQLSLASSADW